MLKLMDQKLMYSGMYRYLLSHCKDGTAVAHVCGLIKALVHQVGGRWGKGETVL